MELRMRAVTPLLIGDWCARARCGKDGESRIRETEIKAASREIFRNVAYQFLGNWGMVREVEDKLFGSTTRAAPVKIRTKSERTCLPEDEIKRLCDFGERWVKGGQSFQTEVKRFTKSGKSGMFFHLRDHDTYLRYASDVIEFRVELVPKWAVLTHLAGEMGLHWTEILGLHMSSIRYSLEILGMGKRRSRGMGRSLPTGENSGLTRFPEDYEELVGSIIGTGNPKIEEGKRVGLKILDVVEGEDKALLSVYLHAKGHTGCGEGGMRPHFMVTAGEKVGKYVVACLVNFHLFRRRGGS